MNSTAIMAIITAPKVYIPDQLKVSPFTGSG